MTAQSEWEALGEARRAGGMTREQVICYGLADENADMTAAEVGFELGSERWYKVALSGYESLMGSGDFSDE